jgi:hypothetical protein
MNHPRSLPLLLAALLVACGDSEDDPRAAAGGDDGTASSSSVSSSGAGGTGAAGGAGGEAPTGAAGTGGGGGEGAPTGYTLTGMATGAAPDASETVDCTVTVFMQNVVYDDAGGFTAEGGGEVFRIVTAGAEKYEFQALTGSATELVVTADGVDVILNKMPDPSAPPFWLALDVLHGQPSSAYEWEGTWQCAPLMVDEPGFHDTKTTVEGTWTLVPSR